MASTAEPLLALSGVSFSYGNIRAVVDVDLEVREGEFIGLIGPNGAGKSTLLDCISGVVAADAGSIRLAGREIRGRRLHRVARAGMIRTFQASRLFPRMTVLSNLMTAPSRQSGEGFVRALFGGWRREEAEHLGRATSLLAQLSCTDVAQNYAAELSGGQQRLVELSRALMSMPRVLLLDEPFAGVSPANRGRLVQALVDIRANRQLTVVMVEHRLELVEALCEHIVVMGEGRIMASGTMTELRTDRAVVDAYLGDYGESRAGAEDQEHVPR